MLAVYAVSILTICTGLTLLTMLAITTFDLVDGMSALNKRRTLGGIGSALITCFVLAIWA